MAEHDVTYGQASGNDYPEHERTYKAFVTLTKWGIIIVAALLVLMAIFLV